MSAAVGHGAKSCGWDRAAVLGLVAIAALAMLVLRDYGISNDEEVQHRYGELIIDYYASGFQDTALFAYKNLYLYGGLFDIIAVGLQRLLPFDVFLIRHALSATFGIAGLAATFATARLVAGPRAGLIALVMLAICGPYFGGMFNHTKDVPFAATMMGAVYFLLRASRDLPTPRWADIVGFGLMLGAATGLRALGLLLIGYAGLIVLISLPRPVGPRGAVVFLSRAGLWFGAAILLGYAIMIAVWPWAALSPLNSLRALSSFAHFHYEIRTVVAGEIYRMAEAPWWYVPFYLLIKLPLVLYLGAAVAVVVTVLSLGSRAGTGIERRYREAAFLVFVVAFPIVCEAMTKGPAFTGMRHFLFVVPPLAVLAGIGFDSVLCTLAPRRALLSGVAGLLALIVAWQISVLVRLHPHQYMFYNELVGGLAGADRRYEMDYWVNTMPEAVQALEDYLGLARVPSPTTYTVGVCGEQFSFEHYADRRLRASAGWLEADFFIAPTQLDCDRLVDGRVVATIRRFGVPIGVVKDRRGMHQKALNQTSGASGR